MFVLKLIGIQIIFVFYQNCDSKIKFSFFMLHSINLPSHSDSLIIQIGLRCASIFFYKNLYIRFVIAFNHNIH